MVELSELVTDLNETELLYWNDPYLRKFDAQVIKFRREKTRDSYVVLNRTIFHPKSGGQPSDRGFIYNSNFKTAIKKAMTVHGIVVHWGKVLTGEFDDASIEGEIDWEWRHLLMKRHTAGHLYDHCLTQVTGRKVETTDSWLGDPCYVGYKGKQPAMNEFKKAELMENQMIADGAPVKSEVISYKELLKRAPEAPNIYRLPTLESYRAVTIEGCDPIPCGGTHLRNICEIGCFKFKETVETDHGFRVCYDVE
jgi:alanyl-tRNA synthetase